MWNPHNISGSCSYKCFVKFLLTTKLIPEVSWVKLVPFKVKQLHSLFSR